MKQKDVKKGHEGWLDRNHPECVSEPSVAMSDDRATIYQELPEKMVNVMREHDLKIRLDKIVVSKLFDQMPGLTSKDGCWSTPSGPRC